VTDCSCLVLFQEPGSNEDILKHVTKNYHVEYPLFAKGDVKGSGAHPLFKFLRAQTKSKITWNFHKVLYICKLFFYFKTTYSSTLFFFFFLALIFTLQYLVGRDGVPLFGSNLAPFDLEPRIVEALKVHLDQNKL
jgi:hypothetical protein